MEFRFKPIGVIHSPFKKREDCPIQPSRSQATGELEVFSEYQEGLKDLDGFSHISIIYAFHQSKGFKLKVKPFLDQTERGLFATRAPRRPNPLGISVVKLISIKNNKLKVKHIDALDGTPLLDIKPFVPEFEAKEKVRIGWLENKIKKEAVK